MLDITFILRLVHHSVVVCDFTIEGDCARRPDASTGIASVPDQSGAPQPVAALRSDAGPAGDFVEAVLRVWPRSPAQLQEFLDRYGGVVIDDNEIPIPPPERRITLTNEQRRATEFVVRIDISRVDPRRIDTLARQAGWSGEITFSSDAGLRTFVAALEARAAGYRADANFLPYGHQQVLLSTQERSTGPGTFTDALAATLWRRRRWRSPTLASHGSTSWHTALPIPTLKSQSSTRVSTSPRRVSAAGPITTIPSANFRKSTWSQKTVWWTKPLRPAGAGVQLRLARQQRGQRGHWCPQ